MIKEAIGIADSIPEATEQAKLMLNAPDGADVMFDVLEQPGKKILGIFGGSKAKVRAYYEAPDEPVKAKKEVKKQEQKQSDKKPKKQDKETPKKSAEPSPKTEAVKRDDIPEYGEPINEADVNPESASGKAIKYLRGILSALGCEDTVITVREREGATLLSLEGEGLGVIIGRHGDTLDALQYLVSLASNLGNGYHKVTIDIGDFRSRREQTLIALAKRVANQALSTGRNRSLEPMNPYERRIIHTAIQEIEGVSSHSVGEGNFRHIVVTVEGGDRKERSHRNGNNRRNARVLNEVKVDVTREPKKDSESLPLYGKIN